MSGFILSILCGTFSLACVQGLMLILFVLLLFCALYESGRRVQIIEFVVGSTG